MLRRKESAEKKDEESYDFTKRKGSAQRLTCPLIESLTYFQGPAVVCHATTKLVPKSSAKGHDTTSE